MGIFHRFIEADQFGSQARFLMAKLNPSVTHNTTDIADSGDLVYTDDASLQVFMDALIKLTISGQ